MREKLFNIFGLIFYGSLAAVVFSIIIGIISTGELGFKMFLISGLFAMLSYLGCYNYDVTKGDGV